jgi:menaquinone-specific isochorismate synthase
MRGTGLPLTYDPGTGRGRYRGAGLWLESTGREIGFASFTFDPEEGGSVVLAPEAVASGPRPATGQPTEQPPPVVVDEGRARWETGFDIAMRSIGAGTIEKVVLARQVRLSATVTIDPVATWARLVSDNPGTYGFLIADLVGASPELLVSLDDGLVRSVVLAGTSPLPSGLTGPRIEVEHELAARSAAAGLAPHTTDLVGRRSVTTVGELSHLATDYTGTALPGTGILDILGSLHPTAAVAGSPGPAALDLIRQMEPPRGRYAGPVGWFDVGGNGCFALALRCGLIQGETVTLYAGGGLVRGSQRETEWAEIESKLVPMLRALDVARTEG